MRFKRFETGINIINAVALGSVLHYYLDAKTIELQIWWLISIILNFIGVVNLIFKHVIREET